MTNDHDTARLAGGRLTIDLKALVENWRSIARAASGAQAAAVLKADGYGIGIQQAGTALSAAGCSTFFVALPEEGIELREAAPTAAIYVLDGLVPGVAGDYFAADLRPVLGSMAEIREWAEAKRRGAPTGSAIHVDTGMNRLGLAPDEARQIANDADIIAAIEPRLLMSHLASADTPVHPLNARQLALFREMRVLFPAIPASLANSAGVFLGGAYHFDLVRPGIVLYGARFRSDLPPLAAVATLEARVLQVRNPAPGETIGYGAAHTIRSPTRVAILGVGYADGYHRAASASDHRAGARAYIFGRSVPLIGRVSMDLIAIDVTDAPDVARGDWVELFGPNVPVDEVAKSAGTIGYELLTSLGPRYARRYIGAM